MTLTKNQTSVIGIIGLFIVIMIFLIPIIPDGNQMISVFDMIQAMNPEPNQPEPIACTLQYDPYCGTDGVTYGNLCMLEAEGATVDFMGEC